MTARRPHASEAERRAEMEAAGWAWARREEVPGYVVEGLRVGWPRVEEGVRLSPAPEFLSLEPEDLPDPSAPRFGIRVWEVDWFARARHLFRRPGSDPWTLLVCDFPGLARRPMEELYAIARRLDPRSP